MHTIAIEIPEALNARLLAFASQRGASEEQVMREALQEYLARQEPSSAPASFAARAAWILDLPADTGAPTDLATNKAHIEGYGREAS